MEGERKKLPLFARTRVPGHSSPCFAPEYIFASSRDTLEGLRPVRERKKEREGTKKGGANRGS